MTQATGRTRGPVEAMLAADGHPGSSVSSCSSTARGARAARLLGADADTLLGALPWEALPWMDVQEIEDCYRSTLVRERPTIFSAVRPRTSG